MFTPSMYYISLYVTENSKNLTLYATQSAKIITNITHSHTNTFD